MGNKIAGYIFGILGLGIMGLSYLRESLLNFLPNSIDKSDVFVTGIVFVIIGVVLLYSKGSGKINRITQVKEEVPIYEGEGKKRKIIAYQKDKI